MVHDEEIDRLKRRLQWVGAGPLTDVANQATDALVARLSVATEWMRQFGAERPWVSILLALQVGFVFGRWGFRRAHH
jgi:ElaB/YqjD/DUF883 family membrane-anchored ribosome-binding protein